MPPAHLPPPPCSRWNNVRTQILGLRRVHERLHELNGHLLYRPGTPKIPGPGPFRPRLLQLLLDNEGANVVHVDIVRALEVVAEIELVDVQWHHELREVCGEVGCPQEGDGEIWAAEGLVKPRGDKMGEGAYR